MTWSTPSAHDSSSRNCQRRLLGHDGGTGTPPWHHDRSLAVSVVQDHSVTHRRSRSLLRLTGGGSTRLWAAEGREAFDAGEDLGDDRNDFEARGDRKSTRLNSSH